MRKTITNYPDYQIDEHGNVWSMKWNKEKQLKGSPDKDGYYRVALRNGKVKKFIPIHRLVYEAFNSPIPKSKVIDHIDRVRTNNHISNLRVVSRQQNNFNNNAKGYSYIPKDNPTNPWRARIRVSKKLISLGCFPTKEQARAAYLEAKKVYHIIDE